LRPVSCIARPQQLARVDADGPLDARHAPTVSGGNTAWGAGRHSTSGRAPPPRGYAARSLPTGDGPHSR